MKKVLIIQRLVPDYRVPFFRGLHAELAKADISLSLLAGAPWPEEAFQDCRDELPFVRKTKNIHLAGPAYWMRQALATAQDADLVVFEQANGALHHYFLLLRRLLGGKTKCAFWGHGAHLNKARPHPLRDAWRNFWTTRVDWWFAYTRYSAAIVEEQGFLADRITTVQNAIDTTALRESQGRLTAERLAALRHDLFGDTTAAPTGVFCGRLTALKWIPFLFETLTAVKKEVPEFRMVIVGAGPEKQKVDLFCKNNPWCVSVGAQYGEARVPYLALSDVWLNPGMTGLAILDSFAMGLPFLTTENGIHSPEIDYLEDGVNGAVSAPTVSAFSEMVVRILQDKELLEQMKTEAQACGRNYTIENMIKRFAVGLRVCSESCN